MTGILGAAGTYAFTPAAVISLSNQEIFNAAAGTATAIYAINSNGSVQDQDSGTLENWLVGSGTNSNYEVRATLVSGVVYRRLDRLVAQLRHDAIVEPEQRRDGQFDADIGAVRRDPPGLLGSGSGFRDDHASGGKRQLLMSAPELAFLLRYRKHWGDALSMGLLVASL
jgi:hypothetical protein